jgi:hypothetical protein
MGVVVWSVSQFWNLIFKMLQFSINSRVNSVSTATGYRMGDSEVGVRFPVEARDIGSGAGRAVSSAIERQGREATRSPLVLRCIVAPWLSEKPRHFGAQTFKLAACFWRSLVYISTPKTETICSSETSRYTRTSQEYNTRISHCSWELHTNNEK